MTKRLTIALIAFLALAMVVVLPAAAVDNVIAAAGDTVFRGEQGINIAATGVLAGDTLGWYAAGSAPGTGAPSATMVVSNPANFYVDPSMQAGAWYRQVAGTPLAFIVADPALDVKVIDVAGNIKNDGTVVKGTDVLRFRIDSNLDALTQRTTAPATLGAPVGVKVTGPGGNVYTSLIDDTGALIPVSAIIVNSNPFTITGAAGSTGVWDVGNANYPRGTYTFKVDCNVNSMNDNYDVVGRTVSKTYSLTLADDDLVITSNKDTVVRNNDFAVTIEGRPSTDYVLWVKGTSSLPTTDVPAIKDGQQGVSKDDSVTVDLANYRGFLAGQYQFSGTNTVIGDTPSTTAAIPTANHYAMVETNSAGKRTVGFSTTQNTRDQSFTIRVDRYNAAVVAPIPLVRPFVAPVPAVGPSNDYDEVKVRVEQGDVTITASGDKSYYIGEEVTLSGTNTDSNTAFLFITGPNLANVGADLMIPGRQVVDDPGDTLGLAGNNFRRANVKGDDTWEFKWDTSTLALDAGTYTIYAAADSRDKDNLDQTKYATVSVVIRKGFVSATASQTSVAKGDKLFVRGNAEGNPSNVGIWVLGRNYYLHRTQTVEDDSSFEYELTSAATSTMASGQYFVVVQHPMGNNVFDVRDTGDITATPPPVAFPNANYVGTADVITTAVFGPPYVAPDVGANAFIVQGTGRLQGSDAAEALIQLLNMPNIDDTYTKLTFLVEEPWIRIDSIGDKTVGSTFTITGTTNLGVDNDLLVEVTSSAFQPTEKTQSTAFSGASGTVKVVKGDAGANTWSFEVDASAFEADEYIVNVESIEAAASTTANFNVLEAVPVTQPPATQPPATQPPATTPPTEVPATPASPGFGALVAIAGLGAVAFLVLRRD